MKISSKIGFWINIKMTGKQMFTDNKTWVDDGLKPRAVTRI